ncbi:hypothetical protein NC651_023724 [Populus alba x Populus x berolinensis]|nr:hypothetical protein NC651_023724 [Populus alba x Populus x berolinensis]
MGRLWIKYNWYKVKYKGLHLICNNYGYYGHLGRDCKVLLSHGVSAEGMVADEPKAMMARGYINNGNGSTIQVVSQGTMGSLVNYVHISDSNSKMVALKATQTCLDLGDWFETMRHLIEGHKRIILQSDSQEAIRLVKKDNSKFHKLGMIIVDVKFLLARECEAQKWARVTRNKIVRALRSKADNIQQVGADYYIWYQSRGRLVLRLGDYDIPHRKRASRAMVL